MNIKKHGFQNSLRCLQHPATVASILLLLLNDHVLKSINPSWLTGKLSDFAGLFFFPFLVAAGMSLLLARFHFTPYATGRLAFGLVAIWFLLLKTTPIVNHITSKVISFLTGRAAQLILDPTDLIALAALLPAWGLWKHTRETEPSRFAYIALCIGALAAAATSPKEPTVYSVTDLHVAEDGVLYAADKEEYTGDWFPVASSKDGGLTWELSNNAPGDLHVEKDFPVTACYSKYAKYCYRVLETGALEHSVDYGEYWSKVLPSDGLSVTAHDILIYEWEGREYALVAIGKGGVLRKELPDGNWTLIPVLRAGTSD